MAIGDYTKTTYVNGSAPALNATNLNNAENKIDEIDTFAATWSAIPAGTMTMFAGSSAPSGWLMCDGSAVSRSAYVALFAAISTTWGTGNGSTTFNLPDMRESSPVGVGTYSAVTGTTHGAITQSDAYALAEFKDDQGQSHAHNEKVGANATTADSNAVGSAYRSGVSSGSQNLCRSNTTQNNAVSIGSPISDGNGTPREGTVTRGKRIGVNFIIKA